MKKNILEEDKPLLHYYWENHTSSSMKSLGIIFYSKKTASFHKTCGHHCTTSLCVLWAASHKNLLCPVIKISLWSSQIPPKVSSWSQTVQREVRVSFLVSWFEPNRSHVKNLCSTSPLQIKEDSEKVSRREKLILKQLWISASCNF